MKKILVIVGPTASGKSDLAVSIANKYNGEIISADSRQVYRGLDIGTGKINKKEMKGVTHHLLDVADPKKRFTVSEYKKLATDARKKIESNKKLPIIVGGSGFYIDAITKTGKLPEVPPNKKLREKLGQKTNIELYNLIKKKDARRAKTIDPHNKIRLIRALEIIEALGKVPLVRTRVDKSCVFIGLKPANLDERIRERLLKRLEGMIEEARRLRNNKLSYKRMNELGLEYRYLALFLQNRITRDEMFEKLLVAIRQYAKRQMTWFKKNKKIKWFELNEKFDDKSHEYIEIIKKVGEYLNG